VAVLRLLRLSIISLWLFVPTIAWSYDLLIVQSQRSPAYDELLRGLRTVARFSERLIVLSDYNEIDLQRIVREEAPIAIITLGDKALSLARKLRQTPVIALMTLNFRKGLTANQAITGVTVQIPPEQYLPVFSALKAKRIGIVSNAAGSSEYIRHARKVAAESGMELVVREVKSAWEVSARLDSLAGNVDLLWMLPDSVTSSGEAADAHFHFSARYKVPVVSFSSAYLASGAAVAIDFDRFEMGKQAGRMVSSLLEGNTVQNIPAESPRSTTVRSNPAVLRRLGLKADIAESRNAE
jgi:putative ABC transport system substrate-binding protein